MLTRTSSPFYAFAALHSLLPSFVVHGFKKKHEDTHQRLSAGVCQCLKLPNCQMFKNKLSE